MKILLVDDDSGIVQALEALLQKLPGHDVRGATTGGQALQGAMALGGVDLLITDVVMEPMDGFTLRDQIATRYPGARTIFISGYDLSDYGTQTAGHQILAKPIDGAELTAAIAREFPEAFPSAEAEAPASEPEPTATEAPAEVEAVVEPEPIAPEPEPVAPEPEPVVEAAPEPEPEPVPAVAASAVAPPQPVAPVAVPRATPVAVAKAIPVSVAKPAPVFAPPKAVPAAVPKATPVAVPKATPVAVPKATPVAAPKAAPVAVPKATPAAVPTAVAKPAAVPAAAVPAVRVAPQPTAAPKAASAVAPRGVAVPKAGSAVAPVPVRASAVPAAPSSPTPTTKATATVKVAPAARVAGAPATPSAIAAASPRLPDDEMVGTTVGAYEIQRVLGDGRWGRVYAALQTSINRVVALKILDPSKASDEAVRARFLGDARAKAHVQHPSIVAVYEAGEGNGHVFYTHEFVDGRNLAQIQSSSERLDEPTALKVLKAAAEGLNYLNTNHIPHSAPEGKNIYLAIDGSPRLANLATNSADEQVPVPQEIQALGRILLSVLPSIQAVSQGFRTLLSRMVQTGPQAVSSWGALVQGIKAIEPKVIPVEAAKISAQDRAAIAAVESARKSQKRSLYINVGSMISLVVVAAFTVWWFFGKHSNERDLDEQVVIPAGSFTFGSGKTVTLPEFSIDKYEVSIGQYGKFVEALENHPTSEFDHEKQPRIKTAEMHKPKDWAIYYGRAKQGKPIHGVPSDLNMPALMVDWWDAYAYAKWRGRELPTEEEWEKAARGTTGVDYPWGNDFDAKKVNSGEDFIPTSPEKPGKVDGFNHWGPVDKQRDKSPTGAIGMAGNVAEWTATWVKDEKSKEDKFPIIKGGSYMSKDVRLDKRVDNVPPQTFQENIGFRTVSRKAK